MTASNSPSSSAKVTRRQALKTTAAVGAGFFVASGLEAAASRSANDKLNIAVIGIGGRGSANLNGVKGENIVALCDVDDKRAGKAYETHRRARKFYDFRQVFDEMEKSIDAVVISTPDHTHFQPAMMAMQMGKHCYCEKPMAHSLWEVREMTNLAAETKVATQLGVQRHTIGNVHRVVELIKAGAIGSVSEVHSWVGGSRGMPAVPTDRPPVPGTLKWDLWLGGAKERPYHKAYCPYGWRFWWDFGTGETGNWGCHILDIPYWALDLKYPTHVSGSGPNPHPLTTPKSMSTRMSFPADGKRKAVDLHWYHASNGPDVLRKHNLPARGNNTLFIGSEGMLLCGFGQRKLYPEAKFEDYEAPEKSLPDSPGFYKEWISACKGGEAATCDFAYSGPLTEAVLLGNVAYRAQGEFKWDSKNLKAVGNAAAQAQVRTSYRKGWEV